MDEMFSPKCLACVRSFDSEGLQLLLPPPLLLLLLLLKLGLGDAKRRMTVLVNNTRTRSVCVCVRISFFANVSRSRRKVFVIFQNAEGACSLGLVGFGEVKMVSLSCNQRSAK